MVSNSGTLANIHGSSTKKQEKRIGSKTGLHLLYGGLVRLVFVGYGVWQDRAAFKYTDIDYRVFSDAARYLARPTEGNHAQGWLGQYLPLGSPYNRATYRYTPLLAVLLAANEFIHPLFGKVLFASCDLLICFLLHKILAKRGVSKASWLINAVWLFNPMVINISTRGSSEAVLGVLVISCLYAAEEKQWDLTAILLGFSVHFKIYPFIYAFSLLSCFANHSSPTAFCRSLFSPRLIRFALISLLSFASLTSFMYLLCVVYLRNQTLGLLLAFRWGQPFLHHAYLYHIHRLDHRHNFSPSFYPIYLSSASAHKKQNPLAGFLPQLGLTLALGWKFGKEDLAFAWFVQTFAFVTLNKVVTSQVILLCSASTSNIHKLRPIIVLLVVSLVFAFGSTKIADFDARGNLFAWHLDSISGDFTCYSVCQS